MALGVFSLFDRSISSAIRVLLYCAFGYVAWLSTLLRQQLRVLPINALFTALFQFSAIDEALQPTLRRRSISAVPPDAP
jgi:hypothetical protein